MSKSLFRSIAVLFAIGATSLGADPLNDLGVAIKKGNLEGVKSAVKAGADVNGTIAGPNGGRVLLYAARGGPALPPSRGNKAIVQFLIESGAEVNGKGMFQMTALHWALITDSCDVATLLINRGADVNYPTDVNDTPLILSIPDCPEVTALLIEKGATVEPVGQRGMNALHLAAEKSKPATIRLLLNAGADRSVTDEKGRTPLDIATEEENQAAIPLLQLE